MSVTDEAKSPFGEGGDVLLRALLDGRLLFQSRYEPSFDDSLDIERVLLAAAATLIARRAGGSRERATRMIAFARDNLEEMAEKALRTAPRAWPR